MKIFCVGRNYIEHAKELNNEVPDEPIIFLKPKSALIQPHAHFYYPEFSNELSYEAELVIRVSKNGKYIPEFAANRYYNAITVGIDFTARDMQQELKKKLGFTGRRETTNMDVLVLKIRNRNAPGLKAPSGGKASFMNNNGMNHVLPKHTLSLHYLFCFFYLFV